MERATDARGRGSFLDRRGELAVLVVLAGLALLLMFFTNSTQARIARHVEDFALAPFRATDRGIRHLKELFVSTRELRADLAQSRLELERVAEMSRENERLRAMLGFEAREPLELIGCEIVAEGAGRLGGTTVVLNRGFNQGIREGMALAGREGLVGKVVEVRPDRAHALLLTHPDCAASVRDERSRVAGIVEWSPGSLTSLKLRDVSYLGDVQVGDRVITSGLGGVFPEGILVGTVDQVERDVTGLTLDITVDPAIDFDALEEVFALKGAVDRSGGGLAQDGVGVVPFRREPVPPEAPLVIPPVDPADPARPAPGEERTP